MKGIILAGGTGTRLYPITQGISKQLMPIYDKPMIYYPLSTLIQAGISDILVITTPEDQGAFRRLLGDGSQFGICLAYAVQQRPEGLAQAFIIGADFIGDSSVALALGDNIFHGSQFSASLSQCRDPQGGIVFAYEVSDPSRYGVVAFDESGQALSIVEKPQHPQSNFAVVGLYFYDNSVIDIAHTITPSTRGELELTSVNEASSYVEVLQKRTGIIIGSPEAAAYQSGFIDAEQLQILAARLDKSGYGKLLRNIL